MHHNWIKGEYWRLIHYHVLDDIRTRWRWTLGWFLFAGLSACLAVLYWFTYLGRPPLNACMPNGSFDLYPDSFQFWSWSGFFQITVPFGNLNFTQAKALDITWDLVVGRGGQGLLAIISWSVFRKYLTVLMRTHPVTFTTYRALFLQSQPSLLDVPRIIRDFTVRLSLHSRLVMCFMVSTMAFILAFPTFAGAMTGYQSAVQAFISDTDGNLVPFQQFNFVAYIIHDGWRINVTSDFVVAINHDKQGDPVVSSYTSIRFVYDKDMIEGISSYVTTYGVQGGSNLNSSFYLDTTYYPLSAPTLNISIFYLSRELFVSDPIIGKSYQNYKGFESFPRAWTFSGHAYSMDYIESNGSCQALGNYQWGFSFVQLNLIIFSFMIWTIGNHAMWLNATIAVSKKEKQCIAGEWKAVLELADAMREQLDQYDTDDLKAMDITEVCIQKRIRYDINGGSIGYQKPNGSVINPFSQEMERHGVMIWLKQRLWWLLFLGVSLGAMGFVGSYALGQFYFVMGFPPAIIIAMVIGSSNFSRAILFMYSLPLFCLITGIPPLAVYYATLARENGNYSSVDNATLGSSG